MKIVEKPKLVKINKIRVDAKNVKTFFLDFKESAKPGQFVMLWLPGVDEKPNSVLTTDCSQLCIKQYGKFTEELFKLNEGDKVGVRGPYGVSFNIDKVKTACIVSGGIGIVPLIPLLKELKKQNAEVDFIYGAQTKEDLVLMNDVKSLADNFFPTTDDGSFGEKGFPTQVLEKLLKEKKYDKIFSCGPELMLKSVFDLSEKAKTECELSTERFMKCSTGVCGHCIIDDLMVCIDGPVFNSSQLRTLKEFGKYAYIKSSRKVELKDY